MDDHKSDFREQSALRVAADKLQSEREELFGNLLDQFIVMLYEENATCLTYPSLTVTKATLRRVVGQLLVSQQLNDFSKLMKPASHE